MALCSEGIAAARPSGVRSTTDWHTVLYLQRKG